MSPSLTTPETMKNLESLYQMLDEVWEDGTAFYKNNYIGNSHYDHRVSRIALLNKEVISHWGVWNYNMRVSNALLKTGGVGAVATQKEYRRRGLMSQLGHASLEAMKTEGYDISVLHGFTSNYARFGYVRAWTDTSYEVYIDDIDTQKSLPLFKQIELNKNDVANSLYNATHTHFTGTVVRPTYQNVLMRQRRVYGWLNDAQGLLGYVYIEPLHDEKVLLCMEVVGDTLTALAVLCQLAKDNKCSHIRFETLPHAHPLLIYLRQGTVRATTNYNKSYGLKDNGWMIRLINLRSVVEKLLSQFSMRLKNSVLADWQGTLLLANNEEKVALRIDCANIRLVSSSQYQSSDSRVEGGHQLVQLFIGAQEPLEVVQAAQMKLTNEAEELVQVLFPRQHPTLASWDQF